jgi:hypothetical protein
VECSQSHELLSAYVDDVLSPEEREQLEKHLSDCPACTEELRALEAYLGAMHSLKRIDAPADFLQSVHDRMEKTSFLRRLVKKIFVPVHIKIPLELAGVVAALLIAVFSHHEVNLQRKMTAAPAVREESHGIQKERPAQPAVEKKTYESKALSQEEKSAQRSEGTQPIELVLWIGSEKDQDRTRREPAKRSAEEQQLAPAVPLPMTSIPNGHERANRSPPEIQIPPHPPLRKGGRGDFYGKSETLDQATSAPQEKQAAPGKAHSRSILGTVDKTNKDQAQPRRDADSVLTEVQDLVTSHDGTIIPLPPEEETDVARLIVARIPARNYSIFLEELRHLGRLQESQTVNGAVTGRDPVLVKISLVPSDD